MVFACPTCGNPLSHMGFRHCPACGQPLSPPVISSTAPLAASAHLPPLVLPGAPAAGAHWLAGLSAGLGTASLLFLPLCLLAVPVGLVSLSAIAQGKHSTKGLGSTVTGVVSGLLAFVALGLMIHLFAALSGLGAQMLGG